jgi:hypothetical protein
MKQQAVRILRFWPGVPRLVWPLCFPVVSETSGFHRPLRTHLAMSPAESTRAASETVLTSPRRAQRQIPPDTRSCGGSHIFWVDCPCERSFRPICDREALVWKTDRAPYDSLQSACCLQRVFKRRPGTQKMLQSSVRCKAGPEAITPEASSGSPSSGFLPHIKLTLTCIADKCTRRRRQADYLRAILVLSVSFVAEALNFAFQFGVARVRFERLALLVARTLCIASLLRKVLDSYDPTCRFIRRPTGHPASFLVVALNFSFQLGVTRVSFLTASSK